MHYLSLSGIEWDNLCKILSTALHWDSVFREGIRKALLFNRGLTENAIKELETAGKNARIWVLYVETEWTNPPMKRIRYIVTKTPNRFKRLLGANEKLLRVVPKRVSVRVTPEILLGIGNACCKVLSLNEALKDFGKSGILTNHGVDFAKRMWNRCHLFWRRSFGLGRVLGEGRVIFLSLGKYLILGTQNITQVRSFYTT